MHASVKPKLNIIIHGMKCMKFVLDRFLCYRTSYTGIQEQASINVNITLICPMVIFHT